MKKILIITILALLLSFMQSQDFGPYGGSFMGRGSFPRPYGGMSGGGSQGIWAGELRCIRWRHGRCVRYIDSRCPRGVVFSYIQHLSAAKKVQHIPGETHFLGYLNYLLGKDEGLISRSREQIKRFKKFNAKIFKITSGSENIICTMDRNVIKDVLVTKSSDFIRDPAFEEFTKFLFGATSLFGANGKEWTKHRTLLDPGFSDGNLKHLFEEKVKCVANSLYQKWKEQVQSNNGKVEINITRDCGALTLDVIAEAGFGVHVNALHDEESRVTKIIANLFEKAHRGLHVPVFIRKIILSLPFGRIKKVIKLANEWRAYLNGIVQERRDEVVNKGETFQKKDIVSRMITTTAENGKLVLNDKEVLADAHLFISAGHETTASTLQWCFYYLAVHTNVQNKILEEINANFENIEDIKYDDFSKLSYTKNVINETLRLKGPAHFIGREVAKTTRAGGIKMPKGAKINLYLCLVGTDEDIWGKDAHEFKPERFENLKINRFDFIPFSIGKRTCIGKNFAMMEILYTVALIVKKFEISIAPENIEKMNEEAIAFTLKPKNDVKLFFKLRD